MRADCDEQDAEPDERVGDHEAGHDDQRGQIYIVWRIEEDLICFFMKSLINKYRI
jgi:hypothetical protein